MARGFLLKNQIIVLSLLLVASVGVGKDKQEADFSKIPDVLFLLGGQSNMHGNGFMADLPHTKEFETYLNPPMNVSIWDLKCKEWTSLKIGKRFGPEIGFAHTLSKALPGKHIGIVKFAAGGTSMDRWKPEGKLYNRLLSNLTLAQQRAPNAKLAAMLWHQGESDTDKKEVAEAYQAKFIQFINSIRKYTKEANLLFIYGQINPGNSFLGRKRWKYVDIVRKAQADLKLSNAVMIKTDDCEKNAYSDGAANTPKEKQIKSKQDNVHYSGKGQIKMGIRFAEAYLKTTK